jgi:hypothetical protein
MTVRYGTVPVSVPYARIVIVPDGTVPYRYATVPPVSGYRTVQYGTVPYRSRTVYCMDKILKSASSPEATAEEAPRESNLDSS